MSVRKPWLYSLAISSWSGNLGMFLSESTISSAMLSFVFVTVCSKLVQILYTSFMTFISLKFNTEHFSRDNISLFLYVEQTMLFYVKNDKNCTVLMCILHPLSFAKSIKSMYVYLLLLSFESITIYFWQKKNFKILTTLRRRSICRHSNVEFTTIRQK